MLFSQKTRFQTKHCAMKPWNIFSRNIFRIHQLSWMITYVTLRVTKRVAAAKLTAPFIWLLVLTPFLVRISPLSKNILKYFVRAMKQEIMSKCYSQQMQIFHLVCKIFRWQLCEEIVIHDTTNVAIETTRNSTSLFSLMVWCIVIRIAQYFTGKQTIAM